MTDWSQVGLVSSRIDLRSDWSQVGLVPSRTGYPVVPAPVRLGPSPTCAQSDWEHGLTVTSRPVITGTGASLPHTNSVSNPKPTVSVISAFLQSVGHDSNVSKEKRASLVDEFRRYRLLASKFTDSIEDQASALQFWSTYGASLPLLSSFARRLLSTPGTSVPSETAFSASSFIGREERCRLTPENHATTMFLRDKLLTD